MSDYYVAFPESDWQRLIEEGQMRQGNHQPTDRDSTRTRSDPNHEHILGYIGEEAFSHISGLPMDRTLRRDGDALIDFRFGRVFTIDTKARGRVHYAMLIKTNQLRTCNHFYVHCWVNTDSRIVKFWGWVPGEEVPKYPQRPARNSSLSFSNYEITPQESSRRDLGELLFFIKSKGSDNA